MCDYSVHLVANRPAKIEDKLVATKFDNSMTRGFAVGLSRDNLDENGCGNQSLKRRPVAKV